MSSVNTIILFHVHDYSDRDSVCGLVPAPKSATDHEPQLLCSEIFCQVGLLDFLGSILHGKLRLFAADSVSLVFPSMKSLHVSFRIGK